MCALKDIHPRQFPTGSAVIILKDAFISVCSNTIFNYLKSTTALAGSKQRWTQTNFWGAVNYEAQVFFRKENMQKSGKGWKRKENGELVGGVAREILAEASSKGAGVIGYVLVILYGAFGATRTCIHSKKLQCSHLSWSGRGNHGSYLG